MRSRKMAALSVLVLALAASAAAKPNKAKPAATAPSPQEIQAREAIDRLKRAEERLACLAEQSKLQAEIQRRSAACDGKAAEFRQCVARVRDRQASNTAKGALIGLGAAVLTGGASLLFTGAGALIGHQASDEAPNECGALPACDVSTIAEVIVHETGLRRRECPAT